MARMLREAGVAHKQRGSRKSLKYIPAGRSFWCSTKSSLLLDREGNRLTTFEVDSRPVVIPSTKGRIMRHRPRLNTWGLEVSLEVDQTMIESETIHQLLEEGGRRLGLGDYRPERGGPFGRFSVVSWKELASPKPKLRQAA